MKLVSVRFMKQIFLGSVPYEHADEGAQHIRPGSKIRLEVNEKNTSVRMWVDDDNLMPWLTVIPMNNVACLVYAEASIVDGKK